MENYFTQETFIHKVSDKEIQKFVFGLLKQMDKYYYKSYNYEWLKVHRDTDKIRVMFDYFGVDQLVFKDFDAYLVCDNEDKHHPLTKIDIQLEWKCYLAEKYQETYLKALYVSKQQEIQKEYDEKNEKIKNEIKQIVKKITQKDSETSADEQ